MKKAFILIFLFLIALSFKAQLSVNNTAPYNSPAYLVNNVLLGNGVSASNITFIGNGNQIGYFSNGLAGAINPLGTDSGIVISSGNVNDIPSAGGLSTMYTNLGDPDLLTIAQSVNPAITNTRDAAILEFDFVPQGDTVEFRFVFASDEYLTWINSVYNDIFAFFLSGPGYTGPYASPAAFPGGATNLALVPGTTTPITISTIHPGLNASYYIDNPNENTFDFNGYTTVISIKFQVTCNLPYHFKFAVADCVDRILDTGVFMEGSSFSSNNPITIQFSTAAVGGDSTVVEGCTGAKLNFIRSDTSGPLTLNYVIGGAAINGVDYVQIPDSVTYLPGIDTASVTITPLTDAIIEGQESLTITTNSINVCGTVVTSTGTMYIEDVPIITAISSNINLQCPTDSILLTTTVTGYPDSLTYTWTNSTGNTYPDTSHIFVSALITDTFFVSIQASSCNLVIAFDTIIVNVIPWFNITSTQSDTNICIGDAVNFSTTISPINTYNFTWSTTTVNFATGTTNTSRTFTLPGIEATILSVGINGSPSCTLTDTFYVSTAPVPNIHITTPDTLLNCVNNLPINVNIGPAPYPNYSYNWTYGTSLNSSIIQNPISTPIDSVTNYLITVTDSSGQCSDTDSIEVRSCCITPTILASNVSCYGVNNGKIIVSATALYNSVLTFEFHKYDFSYTLLQTSTGLGIDSLINLGSGDYIIVITDPIGCSFSDTLTITEPLPVVIENVSLDTQICINGTTTLFANGLGIFNPINLVWDNGLVGNGPHNVYPTTNPTIYNVFAQDTNNCNSDTQSVVVTLFPPIVIVSVYLARDTICKGDTTLITVNATGGGTDLFYSWLDATGTVLGITTVPEFIITPTNSGAVYSVIVSDSCTTPNQSISVTSIFAPIIIPIYTATDNEGCYDVISPNFINTSSPFNLIDSVFWDFDDGSTSFSPFSTPISHSFNEPGTYNVAITVTDLFGCPWSISMPNYQVIAHSYPTAMFNWSPNPTNYLNAKISFNNLSTDNHFNEWTFTTNFQKTSNLVNPTFTFPQDKPGEYNVSLKVTNEGGCEDEISKTVIIDNVFLFYIPTAFTPDGDGINEIFKAVTEGVDLSLYSMNIYNKWGERVFSTLDPKEGWNGEFKGEIAQDGVYIWKIEAKEAHSSVLHKREGFVTILR